MDNRIKMNNKTENPMTLEEYLSNTSQNQRTHLDLIEILAEDFILRDHRDSYLDISQSARFCSIEKIAELYDITNEEAEVLLQNVSKSLTRVS